MIKIALLGRAGSGKSTVASLLTRRVFKFHKEDCKIRAFADPLKEAIEHLFPGCNRENLYGNSELRQAILHSDLDKFIELHATCRQVSIDLGKMCRTYNPAFWVAHLARHFERHQNMKLYVVSDVRFIEEIEWLRQNQFILCKIRRDNLIKINDVSETEQETISDDQFDFIIDNNGPITELEATLQRLFGDLSQ